MDRLPTHYSNLLSLEDKDPPSISYGKIVQFGEQLIISAKQATQTNFVSHDEMERLCHVGDLLQKEVQNVRNELVRRKNLELILPSPNTQKHLPCSNLLAPASPSSTPSQTTSQALTTSTEALPTVSSIASGNASPQTPEYWNTPKKTDPKLRAAAPLYVNLTEQMILAQSSKRKRPTEGVLFCHNCKTKDTPEWRRGPMGAKTLCNACGIRWRLSQGEVAKQHKKSLEAEQQIFQQQHLGATQLLGGVPHHTQNTILHQHGLLEKDTKQSVATLTSNNHNNNGNNKTNGVGSAVAAAVS